MKNGSLEALIASYSFLDDLAWLSRTDTLFALAIIHWVGSNLGSITSVFWLDKPVFGDELSARELLAGLNVETFSGEDQKAAAQEFAKTVAQAWLHGQSTETITPMNTTKDGAALILPSADASLEISSLEAIRSSNLSLAEKLTRQRELTRLLTESFAVDVNVLALILEDVLKSQSLTAHPTFHTN